MNLRSALRLRLSPLAALALLLPMASADTIYRTDGERIQGVAVESETLAGVTYKPSRGASVTIPIHEVDRVEYDRRPALLDEAAAAEAEGQRESAYEVYREYLDGQLESGSDARRFPWAVGHAARRSLDLAQASQNWPAVMEVADLILARLPESRHVTAAYLAKADALATQGKRAEAAAVLGQFASLVESKSLPAYFALEARLGRAMLGEPSPEKRLTELETLSGELEGQHPRLFGRALVARGEAQLQIAFDQAGRRAQALAAARALFEKAESVPGADDRARAGAKTGLAEALFLGADPETGKAEIQRARDLYLRVAVLYPEQVQYAPRALFFAGRCFDLLGSDTDRVRAQRLYREVIRNYPGTPWAEEARAARR